MNYIAYYRVSTQRQGRSGLGLEAQRKMVVEYLGDGDTLVGEHTEVESGKRSSDRKRPELRKALDECKAVGATLLVAKLDRLTRNVGFLSRLLDAQVPIAAINVPIMESPSTSRLVIQILASFAEYEAAQTSERTKAALAARKNRGGKLGTHDQAALSKTGAIGRRAQAEEHAQAVSKVVAELQEYGCDTIPKLMSGLSARGVSTLTGKTDAGGAPAWSYNSVKNILARAA